MVLACQILGVLASMPSPTASPISLGLGQVAPREPIPYVGIASAILASVAALIAFQSYRASVSKLQVDGILNLARESATKDFLAALKTVLSMHCKSVVEFNIAQHQASDEERSRVATDLLVITQFFDRVGYLTRKKHLDEELIRTTYGTMVVEVWQHTAPILDKSLQTAPHTYPDNLRWLDTRMREMGIRPYSQLQQRELAERLRRIADGTATPDDLIFQ
jgi:hypothetical protein